MPEIKDRVAICFANVFPGIGPDAIPTASNSTLPAWDSLTHVRLLGTIEDEFGLQFEMEDFEELVSYPLIVSYLENKSK